MAGALIMCICSCNSKEHNKEIENSLFRIEKSLGMRKSEEKTIINRLKSIEDFLLHQEQVIYVMTKNGFDIAYGDSFEAVVLVRKFDPLDQRNASVVISDSVMPLIYDSVLNGHMINFKTSELGENECYGMVTYNNGQDTMKFECGFIVK